MTALRRDIHSAFESIEPSTAGMPDRVINTVLAEYAGRRRKEQIMSRMRAPLSLVAVFLLIAVVVAVFVGGRLIHDWNTFHNATPAGHSNQTQSQFDAQVALLEQRPLRLPTVKAGAACPDTGNSNSMGYIYGSGPVYAYPMVHRPSHDGTSPHSRHRPAGSLRRLHRIRSLRSGDSE